MTGSRSYARGEPSTEVTPALTIALPEGWLYKESLTLLAPDGGANVIASTESLSPDMSLERYATVQGDLLANEFPSFEEHSFGLAALLGISADVAVRDFSWSPPDGDRVRQIQMYSVLHGRGIALTCTVPESRFEEYEVVLRATLESLVVHEDRLISSR